MSNNEYGLRALTDAILATLQQTSLRTRGLVSKLGGRRKVDQVFLCAHPRALLYACAETKTTQQPRTACNSSDCARANNVATKAY